MDYSHPVFGVNRHKYSGIHPRNPVQRDTGKVHNTIEPGVVEALGQDSRGANLGHGCPTVTSQEKSQQLDKVQAQLRAEFQGFGKGQEEPSVCQFTRQTGRH